jgi:small subunit ribosomal protein S2
VKDMSKDLLITPEEYLKSGIHIGTRYKSKGMRKYIFKLRKDGLKVFSIETIDDKLRNLAKFLVNYDMDKVVVVGRRVFAKTAIEKFCKITGARAYTGRFIPGQFTNPQMRNFFEPQLVFIVESNLDKQAIKEAEAIDIPVVSLSSANNSLTNIDYTIPCNNKGKKSIALTFGY